MAYAGTMALLPDIREKYFQGLGLVDSMDTNPHKGMLVNFDCSALWVKDATYLKEALSLTPPYLRAKGNQFDYKVWCRQLPSGFDRGQGVVCHSNMGLLELE